MRLPLSSSSPSSPSSLPPSLPSSLSPRLIFPPSLFHTPTLSPSPSLSALPRALSFVFLRSFLHFYDRWICHSGRTRWLYVSDLQNNLYVGIKKTGSFQHSSFLYGARVTSAGLIKVSKGHLTSLSPLSGHYRAGTMHFKAFSRALEEKGVDMGRVSVAKSVRPLPRPPSSSLLFIRPLVHPRLLLPSSSYGAEPQSRRANLHARAER